MPAIKKNAITLVALRLNGLLCRSRKTNFLAILFMKNELFRRNGEMKVNGMEEQRIWSGLTQKQKSHFVAIKENATIKDGVILDQNGKAHTHAQVVLKTSESQAKSYKNISGMSEHEEENGGFVFAMFNSLSTMDTIFPTLNQSDLARVMFIGTYTGWGDGQLKYDNGIPLKRRTLEQLTRMSHGGFSELFNRLLEAEIIAEDESAGNLFMNPTLFYRGEMKQNKYDISDKSYVRLFRKTARELYHAYNGRTIKQLAALYAVLPFVNFNYNVICYNPTEPNLELVKPMTVTKLAALLGYKRTENLVKVIEKIQHEGKPVFGYYGTTYKTMGKRGVIISPNLVFAGKAETLAVAKALFTLSDNLK
jgi:hypothetical protein